MTKQTLIKLMTLLALSFGLTACGGGGSSTPDTNNTTKPDDNNTPSVNHLPSITGTPTTTILKDNAYTFTPVVIDSDGDTLTFSIDKKPSWATFDTDTGKLSGTPSSTDVGTTSGIVISVSDGIEEVELSAFSLTVKLVNHAPTISGTPSTSVNADKEYSFTPTATDVDTTDTLVFTIVNQPSWASFDTATGKLSGTPTNTNEGTTTGIVISISDGTKKVDLPAFDLTVNYVNHAPTISGTPATAIVADHKYVFMPTYADIDTTDTLTFSITNKPSWATFDTDTGKLSGTPSNTNVGTTTGIVLSVNDGIETVTLPAFALTVKLINHAPTINGTPATTVNGGSLYSFTPTATDVDTTDTLVFTIVNQPSWASFDTATGKLSGTPTNTNVDTTTGIVISVSDGTVVEALPAFSVEVKYVNHVPTISGTPATTVNADVAYDFTPTGGDVDTTDTLVFTIVNQPSWASFDTATGKLSGTPTNTNEGTTTGIVISISDGTKKVDLPAFDLTVNYVNHAPTISGTPSTSLDADSLYSFSPTHEDVDTTDTLTFSITNKPSWATFNTTTGKLSGTPSNTNGGTTTDIVISVSDNKGGKAELPVFSIEVIFKIVDCRGKNQGFNNATIVTKKSIQGKNSNTKIRLWHTSDGVRKACVY